MSIILRDLDESIIQYCDLEMDFVNISCINKYYRDIIINNSLFNEWEKIKKFTKGKKKYSSLKNLFDRSCHFNCLLYAKYLVQKETIDIHADKEQVFRSICKKGNIEVVKYLIELGENPKHGQINIHIQNEHIFILCCQRGHIDLIKFLIKLSNQSNYGQIDIHAKK